MLASGAKNIGATPPARIKIVVVYEASTSEIFKNAASGTNAGFYINKSFEIYN